SYRRGMSQTHLVGLLAPPRQGFDHPVAPAGARPAPHRGIPPPRAARPAGAGGTGAGGTGARAAPLGGGRPGTGARGARLGRRAGPTFLAVTGRLAGMLVLEDELRRAAPDAVLALRARRMRNVIMLSGDPPEPSRVIAETLGLRHYYADLLPEDKARL